MKPKPLHKPRSFPARHDTAFRAVRAAFGRYFEVHPSCVLAHHDLQHDWGMDRVELALVVQDIEADLGLELADYDELAGLHTVGHLVRLFRACEQRASRAAASGSAA